MIQTLYRKLLPAIIINLFITASFHSKEITGKVIAIKDGDTIEILVNNRPVRIRLYGIDCPEKTQAFGQRAKQFTSDLVFGKVVYVKIKDTDRYGRSVGEVFLSNGSTLNYELVKAGLAWWYRQYSNDPLLGKYEKDARNRKLGLWADLNPVAPWDFRHGKSTNPTSNYNDSNNKGVNYQQCMAITKNGKRCSRRTDNSGYCWQHSSLSKSISSR
jgi:endonuclease YncB( thermonuclease family)